MSSTKELNEQSNKDSLKSFTFIRLEKLGISPSKGLGQNFLINQSIIDKIIFASEIVPSDTVIEVGPGIGALTRSLVKTGADIKAIEIDKRLASTLKEAIGDPENLEVINCDVLESDINTFTNGKPYKVVANLPYYITSPIIRHFLENDHQPSEMVIMVQLEVAQTIMADPGDMSLLALGVQVFGAVSQVCKVTKGNFFPSPKVDSAVIRIVPYDEPLLRKSERNDFFTLARAGFSQTRKQIHNPLSHALPLEKDDIIDMLEKSDIDPRRRAETLSVEEWMRLFEEYKSRI